jgi:hypothetical protein
VHAIAFPGAIVWSDSAGRSDSTASLSGRIAEGDRLSDACDRSLKAIGAALRIVSVPKAHRTRAGHSAKVLDDLGRYM